jgi:CBS domain-containing protein
MYGFVRDVIADKGSNVFTTTPVATVRAAVRTMNDHGVGALLVEVGGRPAGIFTERDVLRRVVDAGLDPETTRVGEVMTRELVTVAPLARVEEAMATMTERRFRHLPVLDEGRLVGMVSIGDLTRRVALRLEVEIQMMADYIQGGALRVPRQG